MAVCCCLCDDAVAAGAALWVLLSGWDGVLGDSEAEGVHCSV